MRLYFASNKPVVVIKIWFCTELKKRKPSGVNFAGFFLYFSIRFFYCIIFYFCFNWVDIIFQKTLFISYVNKVYGIHFCLSFSANPWKKKQCEFYYPLFLFSSNLLLQFVSPIFLGTFFDKKISGVFSCYQIYLFFFCFTVKTSPAINGWKLTGFVDKSPYYFYHIKNTTLGKDLFARQHLCSV